MDRYDTLCDVSQACRTAVDILNDLLCFDKLESGILEVHKHEVCDTYFYQSGFFGNIKHF
jgi:protein involved in sex pheromone biosynthesis